MRSSMYALAGSAASALAATKGFNYASQSQTQSTFEQQFTAAQNLVGADDFASARLYTMIQDGTTNTVISAIPAAIATKTTLLLGLWASEDQTAFDNELTALTNAISQYGSDFTDLVVGISVGSEDLYRISPTGIAADSGYGQSPDVLVDYISQTRKAIAGTGLSSTPVGHVDTWNVYTNSSNSAVIEAADFLGLDEYPYYQTGDGNSISNAKDLFFTAYDAVEAVADGKPIWITETGWPVSGPTYDEAVASTANAETYWQDVQCELASRGINTWWYILIDSGASPSFGVSSDLTSTTPLYDLSCSSNSSSSSSAASSSTKAASASSVAAATMPSSAAASTTVAKVNPVPTAGVAAVSGSGASSVAAASGSDSGVVYVTDVVVSTVTTCPVGQTLTQSGSTTVLTAASVISTTYTSQSTFSAVGAVGTAASGAAAASGTGAVAGSSGQSTLASSWAASQTPTGTGAVTAYTGAASKVVGGSFALALGGVAAALAL